MGPRAAALADRIEPWMFGAALLTIPVLALEEFAPSGMGRSIALVLNWTIWIAFTAEMVAMLALVENRSRWLRTHPIEVAVVLLTPPFLPAAFGALRILRLLPLLRAVVSARRVLSLEGLRFVGLITLSLIFVAGVAFSRLESAPDGSDLSTWDGVWWAVTTVTTVGYGDLSPVSGSGRALAVVVMVLGIGFVAMLTAAAAEHFVRTAGSAGDDEGAMGVEDVCARLDELNARMDRIEAALTGGDARRGGTGRRG